MTHRILFTALLAFVALAFLSCSKDDSPTGPEQVNVAQYAGVWTGTTSDNRSLYFRVNANGVVDSLTVQVRLNFVTVACTYTLSASSDPVLQGDSLIVPVSGVISTTVRGKFSSASSAGGMYNSYSGGVFAICGNNLIIGTTSLSSRTWTATKTGQ